MAMYNNERPHWALGGKTPTEVLAAYSLNWPCHNCWPDTWNGQRLRWTVGLRRSGLSNQPGLPAPI